MITNNSSLESINNNRQSTNDTRKVKQQHLNMSSVLP